MRKRTTPVALHLAIVCLLAMASASAQAKSENMPTVNPYLHNSLNPISHENPAQIDAVDIASGTRGRMLGVDDAKVLHTDIEADSLGEPGRGSKKANPLKNVYFGEQRLPFLAA